MSRCPVTDVLRGDPAQVFCASGPSRREFLFPADHGPHNEYRTEWWYFTGNIGDGKDTISVTSSLFFGSGQEWEQQAVPLAGELNTSTWPTWP